MVVDAAAGLGYAAVPALLLGGYLVAYKRYFGAYDPLVYVAAVEVCTLAWYLPIAAVTLDGGRLYPTTVGATDVGLAIGFAVVTGVAVVLGVYALKVGDVSYVAPLGRLSPVFVLPVEVFLLGAYLAPLQVFGVVCATAAVYVANYESSGLLEPFRVAATYPPAQFALLSSALFGVSDVTRRVLLQERALAPQVVVVVTLVGIIAVSAPFAVSRRLRGTTDPRLDLRAHLPKLAALGLALAVGDHFVALAFRALPASVASPVVNTQAVVAVVLGGVVLGESATGRRLVAALLAVGGVTLLTVG